MVAALSSLRKGGVVAINAIHLDRMPEFDYDRLLWGERQIRSVANMTREDARDFLDIAARIGLRPEVTTFPLERCRRRARGNKKRRRCRRRCSDSEARRPTLPAVSPAFSPRAS